jgi:hypothetical protein
VQRYVTRHVATHVVEAAGIASGPICLTLLAVDPPAMAGVSFGDGPRPAHRLVVTAAVQVDIAPEQVVSAQLLDVSIDGAYVAIGTTHEVGGLVRFSFTTEDSDTPRIAYGRVVRYVNLRDGTGIGIRFTQHNDAFADWIARVRADSPSEQLRALSALRDPVIRLR